MSDDLRDKFNSDEDYNDFLNSFNDYKNRTGMFDEMQVMKNLQRLIKIEQLIHQNFVIENKKYFRIPDEILGVKNMSIYMFYIKKQFDFEEVTSACLN